MQSVNFDYLKCPLHKYTFKVRKIREWVEVNCMGYTLNLFCGPTKLNINEYRVDLNPDVISDITMDAFEFVSQYKGDKFNTILLDPPYAYRKSMEMYEGRMCSDFNKLKDLLPGILNENGRIITFGYHSVSMGIKRGFKVDRIALFSHGGAIHDTIATIEIKENKMTLFNT